VAQVTHETDEIRALARAFAAERLRPRSESWDAAASLDESVHGEMAELGFFGMLVPESEGGMGFDLEMYAAVIEELAWGEASAALRVANAGRMAAALEAAAPDARGGERLGRLAAGEWIAGIGESAAGATAAADGPMRRLSGTLHAVVDGGAAELVLLPVAASEPLVGARTLALVEASAAGYAVHGREQTLGLRPLEIVTVELDEVEVAPGAFVRAAGRVEFVAWLSIAALATGIARAALDHARDYADVREQFGRRLRAFEGIQHKLAEMEARTRAAAALVAAADASDRSSGAAAKLVASEAAMWVATQAVQVFGGYGYMRDYPVEKLMRDAKATELFGDANALLRSAMAAEMYSRD